jgi:hypothetical protein
VRAGLISTRQELDSFPFSGHAVVMGYRSAPWQDTDAVLERLSWRHSGFNVFCGPKISPHDEKAMDNLARYLVRSSFSQERMTYVSEESIKGPLSGKEEKAFDALEWLAAMCSHVPSKGEQMVRYYGHYSNVSRGKRKMLDQDAVIPSILESDELSKESYLTHKSILSPQLNITPHLLH